MNELKKCTHCKEDIPSDKKICPHCQAVQFSFFNKHPLLVVCFCLIVFITCIYQFTDNSNTNNNSTQSSSVETPTHSDIEIGVEAQMQITRFLKSPSTAKFPLHPTIDKISEERYKVSSYVDSQNGFGAMIRSTYTVDFTYLPEDKLKINQIIFDGKEIVNNK